MQGRKDIKFNHRKAIVDNDFASRIYYSDNKKGYNIKLTDEDMRALLQHKCIALNFDDSVVFIYNNEPIPQDKIDEIYPKK